jgi:hypothetical protein
VVLLPPPLLSPPKLAFLTRQEADTAEVEEEDKKPESHDRFWRHGNAYLKECTNPPRSYKTLELAQVKTLPYFLSYVYISVQQHIYNYFSASLYISSPRSPGPSARLSFCFLFYLPVYITSLSSFLLRGLPHLLHVQAISHGALQLVQNDFITTVTTTGCRIKVRSSEVWRDHTVP